MLLHTLFADLGNGDMAIQMDLDVKSKGSTRIHLGPPVEFVFSAMTGRLVLDHIHLGASKQNYIFKRSDTLCSGSPCPYEQTDASASETGMAKWTHGFASYTKSKTASRQGKKRSSHRI